VPLDSYITLGRSGLRVSKFCLGTMTFGEDSGWGMSPSDAEALLAHYLERGGNFVDTANIYTNGHAEKIVGDFFQARPGLRDRVVIGTKFFANLHPGDPNGGGAGRKAILGQLRESASCCPWRWSSAWPRCRGTRWAAGCSPASGRAAPARSTRAGRGSSASQASGSGGSLTRSTRSPRSWAAAPAAVALAWVRSQPAFASTLIDARRLSQFRENLAGLDVQLSDAHLSALDAASTPTLNFPAANNHLFAPMLGFGGMTVDGETPPAYPALAASSARY
jgi:aryl-alcohol dehydrogenase-like predicted oxidoreductase